MSRFYLSHIQGADEEWTATLFRDLSLAVAARTGEQTDAVGTRGTFRALDTRLEQMRGASTLVALYAPGYFSQSYCAAEWSYFEQRAEVLWSRTGGSADAIIPVMWAPPREALPAPVRRYGTLSAGSAAYEREGLLHLLRLKARYAEDYRQVLGALADRVVAARWRQLPDAPGFDLASVPVVGPARTESRRTVRFIMAAPAMGELPEERTATEFYGAAPVDWAPYAPAHPGVLASLVCDTAAALDLAPSVRALDESTVDWAGDRTSAEELVVLLVDAWVAKMDGQQTLLASFDATMPDATTVLEPRNRDDAQSSRYGEVLDAVLDRALPRLRGHATELERWHLPDVETFTAALRKALVRAQNDAMKSSQAEQRLPSPPGGLESFPLLGRSSS